MVHLWFALREVPIRDLLLQGAGVIAILVSIAHGVLGETHVFARATVEPPRLRTLLRLVWQAGTVAWIAGGVLLVAAPWMGSDDARHWIIATLAVVFGVAAAGNALAMRTVHPGWIGMTAVVALAVAGY
jgi:hypothetical protein